MSLRLVTITNALQIPKKEPEKPEKKEEDGMADLRDLIRTKKDSAANLPVDSEEARLQREIVIEDQIRKCLRQL